MKTSLLLMFIISFLFMSCQDETLKECQSLDSCDEIVLSEGESDSEEPIIEEVPEKPAEDVADDDHNHEDDVVVDKPSNLESPMISFGTNIKFVNFKEEDQQKVEQALKELVTVIESDQFKQEVLSHTYKGDETYVQNNDLSNSEIYQVILEGAETLLPEVDQEMDLELKLYYKNNRTIGYTYPSKLRIYMNTKYFRKYETEEVAANLMHEWLHKLGFKHDKKRTSRRKYSVPYAIGYLVEDLIVEMKQRGEL